MKSPLWLRVFLPIVFVFAGLCVPDSVLSQGAPSPSETSRGKESSAEATPAPSASVTIPGPLRPFLRMAGISQQISPGEVLPLLAREVEMDGYSGEGRTRKPNE